MFCILHGRVFLLHCRSRESLLAITSRTSTSRNDLLRSMKWRIYIQSQEMVELFRGTQTFESKRTFLIFVNFKCNIHVCNELVLLILSMCSVRCNE